MRAQTARPFNARRYSRARWLYATLFPSFDAARKSRARSERNAVQPAEKGDPGRLRAARLSASTAHPTTSRRIPGRNIGSSRASPRRGKSADGPITSRESGRRLLAAAAALGDGRPRTLCYFSHRASPFLPPLFFFILLHLRENITGSTASTAGYAADAARGCINLRKLFLPGSAEARPRWMRKWRATNTRTVSLRSSSLS